MTKYLRALLLVLFCACFMRAQGINDLAHITANITANITSTTNSTNIWCNDQGNPGILAACILAYVLVGGCAAIEVLLLPCALCMLCAIIMLVPGFLPLIGCLTFCSLNTDDIHSGLIRFAAQHNLVSFLQLLRALAGRGSCWLSNFNDRWHDHTPLGLASTNGHFAVLKYLIEQCEADGAVTDKNSNTPLHLALYMGTKKNKPTAYSKIAQYLIQKYPTSLTYANNAGTTPMDIIVNRYRGSLLVPVVAKTSPFYQTAYEGNITELNRLLMNAPQDRVRDRCIKKLLPQNSGHDKPADIVEKFGKTQVVVNDKKMFGLCPKNGPDIKIYFKAKELWS